MKNPWIKKNPLISMWFSGANTISGRIRGQAIAAVRREVNKAMSTAAIVGAKQVSNFWENALKVPPAPRKWRQPRKVP